MTEHLYWLGFSMFQGIGPLRFQKLLDNFGTAKNAWLADDQSLKHVLGEKLASQFVDFRNNFSLEGYEKNLGQKKISYLLKGHTNYPQLLTSIPNAPFVLYVKGDVDLVSKNAKTIAVVGTRKITDYGRQITEELTRELVQQGFVIVSGLAMGVDAVAHQMAIDTGGKTIAVLGCGVDCCSPSNNLTIYDKIIGQSGAVVSESAFGSVTTKGMFPSRNRIIAGLSLGVLVTEGAEDSGALITAERAVEYNRPVFAIPGPITSKLSGGPNKLLSNGASLVQRVDDILDSLKMRKVSENRENKIVYSSEEQVIVNILHQQSLYFDEIVRRAGKDSSYISSILSMMEIKGLVKNRGGKFSL